VTLTAAPDSSHTGADIGDVLDLATAFNDNPDAMIVPGPVAEVRPREAAQAIPTGPAELTDQSHSEEVQMRKGRGRWIGDPGRSFREVRTTLIGRRDYPPDTAIDGGTLGPVEIRAASVCGLSHRQSGKPRQDAYGFCLDPTGEWLVVAVADGVSAGDYSHHAADRAVRQGLAEISRRLDAGSLASLDWYQVFQSVAAAIVSTGERLLRVEGSADPSAEEVAAAMSTTASFAIYQMRPESDQRTVTVAWVGDSPIWTVGRNGWRCLSAWKKEGAGGISSSAVAALPYLPPTPEHLAVHSAQVDTHDVLLVMSDGVGDPLGDATGEVGKKLREWWRDPPEPLEFVEQVAFGRKSYDDDRTVVGVWPSAVGAR